jgi:hypothetical protein
MQDIFELARTVVPLLRLSAADKAEEPEIQGKASSQKEARNKTTGGKVSGVASPCLRKPLRYYYQ